MDNTLFRREIGREREGVEWARGLTEEVKLTFFMLKTLGFDRGSKANIFHAENTRV